MPIEVQFPNQGDSVADRLRQIFIEHRNGAQRIIIISAWVGRGFLAQFRGIFRDVMESNPSCTVDFLIGSNRNSLFSSPDEMIEILEFSEDSRWRERVRFARFTVEPTRFLFHPKLYGIISRQSNVLTSALVIGSPNATTAGLGYADQGRNLELYAWTTETGISGAENLESVANELLEHENTTIVDRSWIENYASRHRRDLDLSREFREFVRNRETEEIAPETSEDDVLIENEHDGETHSFQIDFNNATLSSILNTIHDIITTTERSTPNSPIIDWINEKRGGDGRNHNLVYVNGAPLLAAFFIDSEDGRDILRRIREDESTQLTSPNRRFTPGREGFWLTDLRDTLNQWLGQQPNRTMLVNRFGSNSTITIEDLLSRIPTSWGGRMASNNHILAHLSILIAHLESGIN
tara:strand:+ start:401 stop:1627 length:1227 start_codon:yes stop_codon:yes gene_type:complete